MEVKVCSECFEEKVFSDFNKAKRNKDGLSSWCKECCSDYAKEYNKRNPNRRKDYYINNKDELGKQNKQWAKDNPDKVRASREKWAKNNSDKIREYKKNYRDRNKEYYKNYVKENEESLKEYRKQYYLDNRQSRLEYIREYKKNNPEKVKESADKTRGKHIEERRAYSRNYSKSHREEIRIYVNNRRKDPIIRLNKNIGGSMRDSLNGNKRGRKWESLVGYTLMDLKLHLEKLFVEEMRWDNYGEWHIDHKLPISSFDIVSSECDDFKKCWSLSNLQPLWAQDNWIKADKIAL